MNYNKIYDNFDFLFSITWLDSPTSPRRPPSPTNLHGSTPARPMLAQRPTCPLSSSTQRRTPVTTTPTPSTCGALTCVSARPRAVPRPLPPPRGAPQLIPLFLALFY
jgi:hypothetical protein